MTEEQAVRAFLAVPADPDWLASAEELVRRLRNELPEASWTRPESWHLTLHFLGEIPRRQADRFARSIEPHARATPEGDLAAGGAVVFPPRGPARVLGAGFVPSPVVEALSRLSAAAVSLAPSTRNSKPETRNFYPHITFARLRRPWPLEAVRQYRAALDAWAAPAFRARSCVLFESRLDPAGAVHTPLESWAFAGSKREARA